MQDLIWAGGLITFDRVDTNSICRVCRTHRYFCHQYIKEKSITKDTRPQARHALIVVFYSLSIQQKSPRHCINNRNTDSYQLFSSFSQSNPGNDSFATFDTRNGAENLSFNLHFAKQWCIYTYFY